jgi:hypothetical protein
MIWSPGKLTTFVVSVMEIEQIMDKIKGIKDVETNKTIQREL